MLNYVIELTHPRLSEPFVADVNATSEEAAIRRVRMVAMHYYRDMYFLDQQVTTARVLEVGPMDHREELIQQ